MCGMCACVCAPRVQGPVDLRKPDVKMWLMVVDVHQQHGLGDTNMVRAGVLGGEGRGAAAHPTPDAGL